MKNNLVWAIVLLWFLGACGDHKSEVVVEEPQVEVALSDVPVFNVDSAYQYIQDQVDFGPRVPNTESHKATAAWLQDKFKSFGLGVEVQEFEAEAYDGKKLELMNIIASFNPSAKKRVILAAHWDTRRIADKDTERINEPIDGANDGASGVGVLLEIARSISNAELKPDIGIDFILFDGEDDGKPESAKGGTDDAKWWCLGSQYWSRNPHERGYAAYYGILVDMVGAKGARFYKEGVSQQYAKGIVTKVWNFAHSIGHSDFFQMRDSHAITDDHIPVNEIARIPMIDIIDYSPDFGFGRYHHKHSDNMEVIDKRTLKAVGETVLFTIYQE
ncbi:M28 family peptidase [Echinicola sp. CAU 1574]|uniref:M28 family peptidase n=1 Tax=Echinicola arenosa TaxID=2774144 RepID=A0ABR9AKH4_9BACT|nr:M28 family peptidase [Echinicola arenosa]MBD8488405.1 M28 family peptidase [Echinicola arenosa]